MLIASYFVKPKYQKGFTLLEIMVAVVVLAIGLLGLAGLQMTSLRFNSSAYLRSQATNLAYDMADRMRVNANAARAGAYNSVTIQANPTCSVAPAATGTIAAQDIAAWRNALACVLPQGTGSITATGGVFTILVQWDDSRGQDAAQQFTMTTGL